MITDDYKLFKESLNESEEYTTLIMSTQTLVGLDFEMREIIYQGGIRQKNSMFDNDEVHKSLRKERTKIDKQIRDYEFKINHK